MHGSILCNGLLYCVLTCPWFLVLKPSALVLGPWFERRANDSMQSQQKIESIHSCVHGDARAMWVATSEESNATSQGPTAPGESRGPRTKSDGHARFMHKEQSTLQEAKSQGPRTKSQGTRAKDQEPKTKTLPCMDPPPSIIYIYIYICVSFRDPNFPNFRFPDFQVSGVSTFQIR